MISLRPLLVGIPLLALASCAPDGPEPAAVATTEITSTLLLDAAERTVLDQIVGYPTTGDAQVTAAIIEIPPGVETGWHFHEVPLVAHVLAGTLTVTYDTESGEVEKVYEAGDTLIEAIGTHHDGRNDGDETVRLIAVYIGADGSANTVKL
jgi:quercetin dioxygenase-like cupin family protein